MCRLLYQRYSRIIGGAPTLREEARRLKAELRHNSVGVQAS
ncbi:hypothetical protein OP10G_3816 [Fimbriimonas ginsengisoli Gsoil 348]|uniref:Uncharacterized protein n=1 Tax=Fimbriimonas ginsengisoli Gsoil 348 TaxID=661478 RepID=A0A068NYP5_FIMGI|nr:hypothetical protein OP10G_3816 [Fimbriimonas ginsengisoli Gsoil 348]